MQSLSGLSNSDFLTKGQIPLVKFEVYHGPGNYIATMTFDSGSVEPQANEILTGAISSATAKVINVTLASGAWASGTAAGTISLAFCLTRFYENENINGSEGGINMLTVNHPDTAAGVDGYVTNGGMEYSDDGGATCYGWIAYGTPISVPRSTEFKRTKSYSCRIGGPEADEGIQMNTGFYPTLVVGKIYRISAWIYWRWTEPDPPATATFRIGITGDGTATLDTTYYDKAMAKDVWVEIAFTAKCTTGGTIRLYITNQSACPSCPPVFYVDDVTIYEDLSWIDLCDLGGVNYLEEDSWFVDLGGAKMNPNPVAGEWGAVINNQDGIFHPSHPSSFYSDLFEEGKKVRISLGATYSSVDYYWQRITGYMEEPSYQERTHKINISGFDYMKLLIDTELRKPNNYDNWGTTATKSTIASEETFGAEIYDEGDAMEIDTEANNVTNWSTVDDAEIHSIADAGGGTTWVGRVIKTSDGSAISGYAENNDVGNVEQGKTYKVVFKYARAITGTFSVSIYKAGTTELMGEITGLSSDSWVEETFRFLATETTAIRMRLTVKGASKVGTSFKIDVISIKEVTGIFNANYPLPSACNGVYYVTIDGSPVFYRDEGKGWWYDSTINALYIENERKLETGTNNLLISYFTTQTLENVVADLLVDAGLYASQALALAGMNYTATGITVNKVFFEAGDTCRDAIEMCCERANYRFFFQYDGTPDFNPAPTAEIVGSEDVALHEGNYSAPNYYRDKSEIWNRVVIEGLKRAQLIAPEEAMESELRGEENDATSIAAYGEHTKVIKNHLFQDQTSIDAMCVTLLALRKDPNYYFDFTLDYNALPLELADTIRWQSLLAMGTGGKYYQVVYNDGTVYGGVGIVVVKRGIIRNISISRFDVQYKNEEVM